MSCVERDPVCESEDVEHEAVDEPFARTAFLNVVGGKAGGIEYAGVASHEVED